MYEFLLPVVEEFLDPVLELVWVWRTILPPRTLLWWLLVFLTVLLPPAAPLLPFHSGTP